MSGDEYGTLTIAQDDGGTLRVVGTAPDRMLLSSHMHAVAAEGNTPGLALADEVLTINVAPEPLRYRIIGYDVDWRAYQCQRETHTRAWAGDDPDDGRDGPPVYCDECSRAAQEWVAWPCAPVQRERTP